MNRFFLPAFTGLVTAGILLAGCTTPRHAQTTHLKGSKLDTSAAVYVALPPDAFDNKEIALDSGKQTAVIVRDAFAKHARRAYLGRQVESFAEALETARDAKCAYLVYPAVVRWEDHRTEFSGVRDRVEINVEVADTQNGDVVHSSRINGTGPWMTSGGESPRDILPEPVGKYAATLFQVIHTPSALSR